MLLSRFQKYVAERDMFSTQDRILVAVSGGVDSMVMLALFAESGYRIGVAHCNFQLRGPEAEEDELLVEEMAGRYGLPFYNRRFDTMREVEATGESVQMAARRLRYTWFDALCAEHGYSHIAIAHQADDSAETFFINLLRGTGLRGLTGIHVINGKVVRPLLFATRKDIVEYALNHKIPYREDSSNSSTKYIRNKIRLGIIPRIREISPHFMATMTATVERLTEAQRFIDRGMDVIRHEAIHREGDTEVIDLSRIAEGMPMKLVLFELLRPYGFHGEVIDKLYLALERESTGRRFYAKDRVVYLDRGRLVVTPIPEDDECAVEVLPDTQRKYVGGGVVLFEHLTIDDIDCLQQPDNVALIDEDKLHYPMVLRRWKEGDSFQPFGMEGHKKVSDYLIDAKVSLPDKSRQFVLVSGGQIVWLVGRRVDERFRIDASTENVLKLTREADSML